MKEIVADLLKKYLKDELDKEKIIEMLEVPSDSNHGDYAFPCFSLAKVRRKSPALIAEDISKLLEEDELVESVNPISGYLNIFVNRQELTKYLLEENHLNPKVNETSTVMVEFLSPNTNKPLHLGHVRNLAIGESVSRTYDFLNNKVIRSCVYNDRGVHICKSMLAYEKFANGTTPEKEGIKPDHFVGDYYVKYAKAASEDSTYEDEIQNMLLKWEENDSETIELWKKMNNWAFNGFYQTLNTFNIKFDREYYESQIYSYGKEIILKGLEDGIFQKEENGAVSVDLTDKGLDKKILLRSNGTSVYIVQDIYLAMLKMEEYQYNKSLYVVANEQDYHFRVLKEILELINKSDSSSIYHLSYGMIGLPEGRMKSREGTVIDADDLINETKEIAKSELSKRKDLDEDTLNERALKIALAAIKYKFLKIDKIKNFVFNPKESLKFEGDTGPYILYSYARAKSIMKKVDKIDQINSWDADEDEAKLVNKLIQFEEIVKVSNKKLDPSVIANYSFELCQTFNEFYHKCPVLDNDKTIERLNLVNSFSKTISTCLYLLGIEPLEEM